MRNKQVLNQSQFPFLWLFFQYAIGGNSDKKQLIFDLYKDEKSVLEVGCSMGNVSDVFRSVRDIQYHGIDIDERAIDVARHRFIHYPNFKFICENLEIYAKSGNAYSLIYFAGVLHHVSDDLANSLLHAACALLNPGARICVIEPLVAKMDDSPLVRWYANVLEQGEYLRSAESLGAIVKSVDRLTIESTRIVPITATPFHWPLCAHFLVIEARRIP